MIAPGIYDLRYGAPSVVEEFGCGPFSAGKGAIVTDGASAFFQVGVRGAMPAPDRVTGALRTLMSRPKGADEVPFFDLTHWLSENFATCAKCVKTAAVCERCTTRCGFITGVPVYGWHVRRQLSLIEHRPPRVHLAALADGRGQPVLHVSCDQWTYIRVGVVGELPLPSPEFPPQRGV